MVLFSNLLIFYYMQGGKYTVIRQWSSRFKKTKRPMYKIGRLVTL